MRVYIAVEWREGFFYGIGYTLKGGSEEETVLYKSYAYSDKRDAQLDVLEWYQRWLRQGRVT